MFFKRKKEPDLLADDFEKDESSVSFFSFSSPILSKFLTRFKRKSSSQEAKTLLDPYIKKNKKFIDSGDDVEEVNFDESTPNKSAEKNQETTIDSNNDTEIENSNIEDSLSDLKEADKSIANLEEKEAKDLYDNEDLSSQDASFFKETLDARNTNNAYRYNSKNIFNENSILGNLDAQLLQSLNRTRSYRNQEPD
jgi:hypothetical protein